MWTEIVNLFNGYGIIPMVIILFGVLLLIIEVFVPGFGIFGISGSVLSVGGIVARMIMGATATQLIIMILSVASLVVISIILMLISAKCGLIKYSPIIETKTSVPVNYGKDNKVLVKTLLGKVTFATTEFRPVGKFEFNGELYEASTYGDYISKGQKIRIVEIKADRIYVRIASGENGKTK